jgi:hypothetical protein
MLTVDDGHSPEGISLDFCPKVISHNGVGTHLTDMRGFPRLLIMCFKFFQRFSQSKLENLEMIFGMWAGDENETGVAIIVIAHPAPWAFSIMTANPPGMAWPVFMSALRLLWSA